MSRPDVSVVVPTQNRWPLVRTAVACATGQRGVSVEVVLVDDGSAPATAAHLRALAAGPVRLVRHDVPAGLPAARTSGIAAARGAWVAFLDDDDLWAPDKLARQLAAARAAAATWAYCAAVDVDAHRRVLGVVAAPDPASLPARLPAGNVIPAAGSNVVVRADVLARVGGFDPALPHSSDWDLWLRLARTEPAAACPEPLVAYVHHRRTMRSRGTEGLERELAILDARHAPPGGPQDRAERHRHLRWVADAHRAAGRPLLAARTDLRTAVRHRDARDVVRAAATLAAGPALRPLWARWTTRPRAGIPAPAWLAEAGR